MATGPIATAENSNPTCLGHRAFVPQAQFRDRDTGRCVAQRASRHRHGPQPDLVHALVSLAPVPAPPQAAAGADAAGCAAGWAGSDAAFFASSRSTTFIIGEAAVSAFFILIVRWRSTASL
jgi:hypothetical protein